MSKRVLLTGIGGSIGCHVFRHIMQTTDWGVVGIDSFRHKGLFDRLDVMLKGHPADRDRLTLITQDLTAPISNLTACHKIGPIDYIINMASLSDVHASLQTPRPFVEGNVAEALTVLDYARNYGCEAFLQISTDEVYGPTDGNFLHGEWDPILPSNPYSASKACQEAIGTAYWRSYAVPLIVVNIMNNFGEMQSAAKFPAMVQRKIRKREKIIVHSQNGVVGSRVYIHSRNTADALLFILKHCSAYLHQDGSVDRPLRYNIVGDQQVKNDTLIQFIASCIGKAAVFEYENGTISRPGHDLHYGLNGGKLAALGWKQPLSFSASMRNTVAWYEEHPEWLEPYPDAE